MDKAQLKLVADTVSFLAKAGIEAVDKPTADVAYKGAVGSISNYRKITLGEISPRRDPCGDPHLAVYVHYIAERESGEDLCDFYREERRYVTLKDLPNYLSNMGWPCGR